MQMVIDDRMPRWLSGFLTASAALLAAGAIWVFYESLVSEAPFIQRVGGIAGACVLAVTALAALIAAISGGTRVAVDDAGNVRIISRLGTKLITASSDDVLTIRSVSGILTSWHVVIRHSGKQDNFICNGETKEDALQRLSLLRKALSDKGSLIVVVPNS